MFWYTREKQDDNHAAAAELLAVKQREEDLMAEARHKLSLLITATCDHLFDSELTMISMSIHVAPSPGIGHQTKGPQGS